MSSDKKKNGKFLTKILIGGALGSVVAWAFGNRKRRETISDKAHDCYTHTKEKMEQLLSKPEEPKKSFFKRMFGRKS